MTRWVWLGLVGVGCDRPDPDVLQGALPADGLLVATASDDYAAGGLAVVDRSTRAVAEVATTHGDAVVSVDGGAIWQINRLGGDSVRRYDPDDPSRPVWETSTGDRSNPQDARICGGALVVSRYGDAGLLQLDPETGEARGTVDLGAAADADGLPEAAQLVAVGEDRIAVALQRWDRTAGWIPDAEGRVALVDCVAGAVEALWPVGANPVLVDGGVGLVLIDDAGLRVLDPGTGGLGAPLVTAVAGLPVVDAAFGPDGRGVVVGRDDTWHATACLDLGTGALVEAEVLSHFVSDVAVADGWAWLAARRGWVEPSDAGGVFAYDLADCTAPLGPDWVRTAMPPFDLGVW